MKKIVSSLAIIGMFTFGFSTVTFADQQDTVNQNEVALQDDTSSMETMTTEPIAIEMGDGEPVEIVEAEVEKEVGFTSTLKKKFIEGDPFWMGIVLIALIIGIALCIERIVYLNLSSINTKKFLADVEEAISKGDIEGAKEICRNTRGPIASIFYQGLARVDEGVEAVEKTVVAYGGVQMGLLEKGISWISLFIALAPMLGFMGTVIGMIQAFEKIVEDGQVSPITVAGGIQVALLTTVFGLISAIILQIFYNYIVAKVDGIVNEMENSSITLVDMMIKYKVGQN
jgi:biopolymer transport protein ExbB